MSIVRVQFANVCNFTFIRLKWCSNNCVNYFDLTSESDQKKKCSLRPPGCRKAYGKLCLEINGLRPVGSCYILNWNVA